MLNREANLFPAAGRLGGLDAGPLASAGPDELLALAFLLLLALGVWAERRKPFLRPGLATLKNSYLTNFCAFLCNDVTLSLLSVSSLYYLAQRLPGDGLLGGMEDGFAKYALGFVLLDLALYGWHYAAHHVDSLWTVHKVHHSDKALNITTGLRFHLGELVLEVLLRVAFISLTGIGAETVLANQAVISLFVLFHHANVSFPGERLLSMLFVVPRLHRMHHSVSRQEHDSNYGAVFSVWDRLFGTLREGEPKAIGLQGVDEQSLVDLVKYGFTRRIQFKRQPVPVRAKNGVGL